MNTHLCLLLGAMLGAIGVAAGALGAHLLKAHLDASQLVSYETAVRYQIFHALALLAVGLMLAQRPSAAAQAAGWCFVLGTTLFSGGIYAWLATGLRPLVHVVPLGGVTLIGGWVALFVAAWGWRPN